MADILLTADVQLGTINTDDVIQQIQNAINRSTGGSGGKINITPIVDTAGIEKARSAITRLSDSARFKIDFGQVDAQFESIIRKSQKLQGTSQKLQEALSLMGDAVKVMNSSTASDKQKGEAFKQFGQAAAAATAQIKLLAEAERDEANAAKEAERTRKDEQNSQREQLNLQKQLYNQLRQAEDLQRKIADGAGGTGSKSYQDITALINDINGLLNSDGPIDKTRLAGISASFAQIRQEASAAGDTVKGFGNGLSQLESRFVYMFSLANVFMQTMRQIKQMVKTTVELDSAMTQLRVVTNASETDYANYGKSVASTAKEIGASITDLIDSTTVFARLGYSLNESSSLAKYTTMLSNVGNIDVASAQNALTAITKAYDISASEIETVMDKMVVVGNNFPISVSQIAEGMNNAGSALAAAGNSFEESVALLTAANTTIQNVSKSSTGLRTITARIRRTKTELDDLGETVESAKYEEVINNLTKHNVLLTTANGEYRSTYEIMQDIAGVWGQLSSMEQAAIAEQLAGKIVLLPERTEMCA